MSNYVIYLENVKYYRVSVSTFHRRWLRHMIGKNVPLNLRNGLGYKWHITGIFGHPNSLSWVRVHLWMRMSELVELSPSSWDVTRHPSSLSWVRVHLWAGYMVAWLHMWHLCANFPCIRIIFRCVQRVKFYSNGGILEMKGTYW